MTPSDSNALSSRFKLWGSIFVICGLLGAGLWLTRGWLDLFKHISLRSDGPNIAQSNSTEPFQITLKTKVVDEFGNDKDQIVEWDLNIPRAFVTNAIGENGSVRTSVHEYPYSSGGYFVSVEMQVLDDGKTVVPHYPPTRDKWQLDDNSIRLGIVSNGSSGQDWWIAKHNVCVQQHLYGEIGKQYDSNAGRLPDCYPTIKYCTISTQLDGWRIVFSTTKKLYAQPEKTCSLVKAFLDKYTVMRDAYPVSEPIRYPTTSKKN
jgi:hypothetical protein